MIRGDCGRRCWRRSPRTSLTASKSIRSSFAWSPAEHTSFVAEFVDSLDALPYPIRLILDDVAELDSSRAASRTADFAANSPAPAASGALEPFRTAAGTEPATAVRATPRIPNGPPALHPCRVDDPADQEWTAIDGRAGESLHRRTGGWAAGMRLAALAIADGPDPDRFVAEFSGDERCVADFLTGEVLDHLKPEMQAFLRAISIADPISTELAAALSGRDDAGALLDALEHDMSLLAPVGWRRDTYCMQPLLRTYLRADLRRHGLRKVHALHAVAARWWAAENDLVRALDHARHSDDAALRIRARTATRRPADREWGPGAAAACARRPR